MKNLIITLTCVFILFGSYSEASSIRVVNGKNLNFDPFEKGLKYWVKHLKKEIGYDEISGYWKFKNCFIAVGRKGKWVDIASVTNDTFGAMNTVKEFFLLDEKDEFITDIDETVIEMGLDPSLGKPKIHYKNGYSLGISRAILKPKYLNKEVILILNLSWIKEEKHHNFNSTFIMK